MPDFTPEAPTPNPTEEMLVKMAWKLCLVPHGAPVHRAILDVLRRQFIAAHEVDAAVPQPPVDAWKLTYDVARFVRTGDEYLLVTIAGRQLEIPRPHAVYLHGLMADRLAPRYPITSAPSKTDEGIAA